MFSPRRSGSYPGSRALRVGPMPPRASVGPGCGTGPGHRRTRLPWAGEISKLSLNMAPKWRAERRVTSPWLPSESESGPGPGRVRVTVGLGLRVTSRPASSSRLRVRVPGPASLSPSLRFESGSEPHRGPGPAGPRRLLRTVGVTESSIVEIGLRLLPLTRVRRPRVSAQWPRRARAGKSR